MQNLQVFYEVSIIFYKIAINDYNIIIFYPGPILIDTYNMSIEAGRATATDIDVLNTLEQLGGLSITRTETFNKIMNAKTDISELSLEELMIKDLKITNGIPLVGFSLLVEVCYLGFLLLVKKIITD